MMWLTIALAGCVEPVALQRDQQELNSLLERIHDQGSALCLPAATAVAETEAEFAALELQADDMRRARDHMDSALVTARMVVQDTADCLSRDQDGDGITDVDDLCPDEPEDLDGDRDEDGCPEEDPDSDNDGFIDDEDGCPDDAEDFDDFEDDDGCPDEDNDEDTVLDVDDACPLDPEDIDGVEDDDGCPDNDNDGDGVLDDADECPDELETMNNYVDEDGCPDELPQNVRIIHKQIVIGEKINFASGRSTLLSSSHGILNSVALVIRDNAHITVRIEGHTDSQGGDDMNQRLSERRAAAVRTYLLSQGVEAERLESVGFGESRPVESNRSPEGRATNRRVEFHITSGMD